MAKERIHEIVYAEQIAAEKERAEAEAKALEEEQATNFNDFIAQFIHECETGNGKEGRNYKYISWNNQKLQRLSIPV